MLTPISRSRAVITVSDAANEAGMLALSGVRVGDMCRRTDLADMMYVLRTLPASTLSNWTALAGIDPTAVGITGGTISGVTISASTVNNEVDSSGYSTINAAVTAIGATPTTLVVSTAETLAASITFPATLTLEIRDGGSIVKAATYTVTINGPFSGTPGCFSGFASGNVTFGYGAVDETRPDWWTVNAIPGTTDMASAINYAIQAAPNLVRFNGLYAIASTVTLKSGCSYLGPKAGGFGSSEAAEADHGAIIKWIGADSGTMIAGLDLQHWAWEGIDLDGGNYTYAQWGTIGPKGFYLTNSGAATWSGHFTISNLEIRHCKYAIDLGDTTTNGEIDVWVIEKMMIWNNYIGIRLNSGQAGISSKIANGTIANHVFRGIDIQHGAAGLLIDGVTFGGIGGGPASVGSCYIYVGTTYGVTIRRITGYENVIDTGWYDVIFGPIGTLSWGATILQNNLFGHGIITSGTGADGRKIISIGNQFLGDAKDTNNVYPAGITDTNRHLYTMELNGIDEVITIGDHFTAPHTGIKDKAGNAQVIEFQETDITGGVGSLRPFRYTQAGTKKVELTQAGHFSVIKVPIAFTANDTTPSVLANDHWFTVNSAATRITNFDDGVDGQVILVNFADNFTTIAFSGSTVLFGNSGIDWTPGWADSLLCHKILGTWRCQKINAHPELNNVDLLVQGAGRGIIQTNAAGTLTKRARLNNTGDGWIFEDVSVTPVLPPPGSSANLITAWVNSVNPYDTFAATGADITSAIVTDAATHSASTGLFWIENAHSYTLTVTVTLNSGQAPTLEYFDGGLTTHSHSLTAGVHVIVFTSEGTQCNIAVTSTAASNWSATFTMVETP